MKIATVQNRPDRIGRFWPRPVEAATVLAALTSLLVLVLTVYPVARLEVGRVPVYISDLLIGLALLALLWRGRFDFGRFGLAVLLFLAAWLPAWVLQMATLEIFLEPTYGLFRNVLAVGCFFVGFAAARQQGLARLGKVLVIGVLATSILAIAQQLPITREPVHDFLVAAAPAFAPAGYVSFTHRAFGFFMAATTLSGFLAVVIPLLLVGGEQMRTRGQAVALAVAVVAGVAAIATFSRQWLPALAVGLLVLAALRRARLRRILAWGALTATPALALLLVGGLDASYFAERFGRLAQGSQDPNVAIRIERQAEYLEQVGAGLTGAVRSDAAGATVAATGAPTMAPGGAPTVAPTPMPTRASTSTPNATPVRVATGAPPTAPISVAASAPTTAPNSASTSTPNATPVRVATGAPAAVATRVPIVAPSATASQREGSLRRVEGWQILVGRGFANQDLIDRGVVDAATAAYLRSGFNDNVFLLESYNHGILAGLVYLVLVGAALVRGVVASRWPGAGQTLAAGLTASLATASVLHFFDNYFSEIVFMKAGLWLLIGVLMGCVASGSDRDSGDEASAEYKLA